MFGAVPERLQRQLAGHTLEQGRSLAVHARVDTAHERERARTVHPGPEAVEHRRVEGEAQVLAPHPEGAEALDEVREGREDEVVAAHALIVGRRGGDLAHHEASAGAQGVEIRALEEGHVLAEDDVGPEVRDLLAGDAAQQVGAGARAGSPRQAGRGSRRAGRAALGRPAGLKGQAVGHHLGGVVAGGAQPEGERVRGPEAALHELAELLSVRAPAQAGPRLVVLVEERGVVGVDHQDAHQSLCSSTSASVAIRLA